MGGDIGRAAALLAERRHLYLQGIALLDQLLATSLPVRAVSIRVRHLLRIAEPAQDAEDLSPGRERAVGLATVLFHRGEELELFEALVGRRTRRRVAVLDRGIDVILTHD